MTRPSLPKAPARIVVFGVAVASLLLAAACTSEAPAARAESYDAAARTPARPDGGVASAADAAMDAGAGAAADASSSQGDSGLDAGPGLVSGGAPGCGIGPSSDVWAAVEEAEPLIWSFEARNGAERLRVDLFEAFGGPSRPGSGVFVDADSRYETAGMTVVLGESCRGVLAPVPDCDRLFMPEPGGQWTLDRLDLRGGRIAGRFDGVRLRQVTIRQLANGARTEDVPEGEVRCLDGVRFDAALN
jgi:hypothetical protein